MMPCPLGAFCPSAVAAAPPEPYRLRHRSPALWCAPYAYRQRPGLGCGGADRWTVIPKEAFPGVGRWEAGSGNLYCSRGYYCPNTTQHKIKCPRGYFCRQGSSEPVKCPPGAVCPPGSEIPANNWGGVGADAALLSLLCVLLWMTARRRRSKLLLPPPPAAAPLQEATVTSSAPGGGEDGGSGRRCSEVEKGVSSGAKSSPDVSGAAEPLRPLDVEFRGLSIRLKTGGREVLSGVSAGFAAGKLTAIMGPSGAGKSSLLCALAGRAPHGRTTGQMFVNGRPDTLRRYAGVMGFVPQDDVMHGSLTVEETLLFSARIRLPRCTAAAEHRRRVDAALTCLGLSAVRRELVGDDRNRGISGGERKRVSIGIELVCAPRLLLLDEPTSGLDATAACALVRTLVALVRQEGVTAAAVVHQPRHEAFVQFDDLILLAVGGRAAFYGRVPHVEPYFLSLGHSFPPRTNPADALLDLVAARPDELADAWRHNQSLQAQSPSRSRTEFRHPEDGEQCCSRSPASDLERPLLGSPSPSGRKKASSSSLQPGFLQQFRWCFGRAAKERARQPLAVFTDLAIVATTGTTVGLLSDRGRSTILSYASQVSYSVIALALAATVSAAGTFSREGPSFQREAASGLNRVAYFAAMDALHAVEGVVSSGVYLVSWVSFANSQGVIWQLYLISLALYYVCAGTGFLLELALGASSAQLGAAVFTLISTLVARQPGRPSAALAALQAVSFARWALEGFVIAESNRLTGVWVLARCADLVALDYDVRKFWRCLVALVVLGMGFRAAALGMLVRNRSPGGEGGGVIGGLSLTKF